jgi:hypothetical protein
VLAVAALRTARVLRGITDLRHRSVGVFAFDG